MVAATYPSKSHSTAAKSAKTLVGAGVKPALNKCSTLLASAVCVAFASILAPLKDNAEKSGIAFPLQVRTDRTDSARPQLRTLRAVHRVLRHDRHLPAHGDGCNVARVEALDQQRKALREAEKAIARADDITARAAAAYADVQAWVALDDAVEALPNEMLAAGLAPLNALLRELAGHARPDLFVTPRGLPLVPSVSPDMSIRCGHRPYHGLSKSERWRIDALLGAAVASLSGHRLLVLDESDMLQPGLRPSLLGWLDALVTAGHLETALVMATMIFLIFVNVIASPSSSVKLPLRSMSSFAVVRIDREAR